MIRNSITNPKMSRAVTLYNKVTYNNISSAEFAVDGKLAFCLEYAKTTPPAGTATGTPTEITNSGVKAAMYYGYTGPAAAQYNFSSTSQAVLVTATLSSYYYSGLRFQVQPVEMHRVPDLQLFITLSKHIRLPYHPPLKPMR